MPSTRQQRLAALATARIAATARAALTALQLSPLTLSGISPTGQRRPGRLDDARQATASTRPYAGPLTLLELPRSDAGR